MRQAKPRDHEQQLDAVSALIEKPIPALPSREADVRRDHAQHRDRSQSVDVPYASHVGPAPLAWSDRER
jgi:hypothetical protein